MNNKPRVAFLIPFTSRQRILDWHLASSHLQQTLGSIFNSTNGNYCTVVAGHEAPDFDLPLDSRFKFLQLNHPLPSQKDFTCVDAVRDKMTKLAAAWNHAKSTWNPDYVMKVDADDFISSKLVGWLDGAQDLAGYQIKDGWIWCSGSRHIIERCERFNLLCGTCLIIRSDLADSSGPFLGSNEGTKFDDATLRIEATNNRSLVPGAGAGTLLLNNNHLRAEAQFIYLGHKIATVPFRAAVYRVRNPQSITKQPHRIVSLRMLIGRIRRTRLISATLRREFMLE